MLDLTMYMLVGAVLFFILSIIFKSGGKLDIMSLLLGVLALASVMQDEEIVERIDDASERLRSALLSILRMGRSSRVSA